MHKFLDAPFYYSLFEVFLGFEHLLMPDYSNSWMLHFITLYSKYFLGLNICLCLSTQIPGYSILLLFTRSIFWFWTPAYAWILKFLGTPFYYSLFEVFFGFEHLLMPEYSNSWVLHFITLYSKYSLVLNTFLCLNTQIPGYSILLLFTRHIWGFQTPVYARLFESLDTSYYFLFTLSIPGF